MSFTSVEKVSVSVPKTLLEFAKDRYIETRLVDFDLISYDTVIKRETDSEYKYVEDIKEITKEDILNSYTELFQEYRIKIRPATKLNSSIQLSIATNKLKTKAVVTIKKGSIFTHGEKELKVLKKQIWLKKLKNGLLINIFETTLNQQLQKLIKLVPQNKPISKDIKLTIALGLEPVQPIDEKHDKIFERLEKNSDSVIDGVNKDTLIFKYLKPKKGKNGRSCNGKFLLMREPFTNYPEPKIDQTITKKEFDEYIEYYSNESGFVVFNKGELKISKQLKLDGANFKSTANIDSGKDDNDVSVHIGHSKCKSEDAIGSGVNIDVKELNVEGSVAGGVKISTQELTIDAQTHKNAKMEVENTANIKLHRGDLTAKEANVDVLESGKITAHKSIYVKQMIGGTAIAPIVKVDELLSNAVIIASKLIEIQTLAGSNNKLIIDPDSIGSHHKDIEEHKEIIITKKKIFKDEDKELNEKIKEHSSQAERIKTFQKRIVAATKSGKTPSKQDSIRVRQFKKQSDALKLFQENLAQKKSELQKLNNELEDLYNKDLGAKIVCKNSYDGTQRVIFINPKTKEEIPFTPEGSAETISLVINSDGERVIKIS